jgi:hypothetical protein
VYSASIMYTLLLSEFCPGVAVDLNVLTCFFSHSPIIEKLIFQLSKVWYFFRHVACVIEYLLPAF